LTPLGPDGHGGLGVVVVLALGRGGHVGVVILDELSALELVQSFCNLEKCIIITNDKSNSYLAFSWTIIS
jgi:hypothetical protein